LVLATSLHEAGWGPQQLATELVEDLRETFLAALAPELAGTQGDERGQHARRAQHLGLPRLVRSIEVLGRAQVDMREAPDARIVLEVALVRLARPELDDSPSAVLDRLARVERAVANGQLVGHIGASPTLTPGSSPAQAPSTSAASPRGSDPSSLPPSPASSPSTSPGALPTSESSSSPGSRPTIGALRKRHAEPRPTEQEPIDQHPAAGPDAADAQAPHSATAVGTSSVGADDGAKRAGGAALPDRDMLVQAWGDHLLRSLTPKAKALYSAGRFVTMEGDVAVFALPTAPHRDRCEELRAMVEQAIAASVGSTVRLRLIAETDAPPVQAGLLTRPGPGSAGPGSAGPEGAGQTDSAGLADDIDEEDFDPDDLGETVEVESVAHARLLEAFPGAEEVEG
jgi:DNA polymerase-3 subunit gamma/tau